MADSFSNLQGAAHAGAFGVGSNAPSPTPEQIRAGNYAKGATRLHGLPVTIETPMYQSRRGKQDGVPWSVLCMAHYGYINGTKGADGDAVDVFVGPMPESRNVYVVNQFRLEPGAVTPTFDEHKVLLGFDDPRSAFNAYLNSYEKQRRPLAAMIPCSIQQFKYWLKHGDLTKPLQPDDLISSEAVSMTDVLVSWDAQRQPVGASLMEVLNDLRRQDPEGLLFDSATLADINESLQGGEMLDAMVIEYKQFERKAGQLLKVMQNAAQSVKPVSVEVTKPFKNRGTTQVAMLFTMDDGQTVAVFFHNPDSTPDRLTPSDELVSWKWVQNKKDVTITVAPERGQDLNPREVARRIMGLIQKNSAKFLQANTNKAERDAKVEELKTANDAKAAELEALDKKIVELTAQLEQKKAQPQPTPSVSAPDATSEPTEAQPAPAVDDKDFERWEEEVIFAIAAITEMEFSGARGMASDKEELVRQLYADQTPPQKAGEAVVAAAKADPEPEFTPPPKPGPNRFVVESMAQAEIIKQKIIAAGGTPLSESEFMDKVNAGELPGKTMAVNQAKLVSDQADLVLVEAGEKTPKSVVGPGGTKYQALAWLHRSIAIGQQIIASGGMGDPTNARSYRKELEAQLESLETQQPPAPPAAPAPEPASAPAEPPPPDEDEKLQQAKAYLDTLIAGAENIGTPAEVLVELERIYAGWGEGELKDLFAEASDAYRDYALKATAGAF